jgi:hypothetical protein
MLQGDHQGVGGLNTTRRGSAKGAAPGHFFRVKLRCITMKVKSSCARKRGLPLWRVLAGREKAMNYANITMRIGACGH